MGLRASQREWWEERKQREEGEERGWSKRARGREARDRGEEAEGEIEEENRREEMES